LLVCGHSETGEKDWDFHLVEGLIEASDLFCILFADYPQVPPSVHFMTTGGGKVRFNPNLYSSGKICLSLLGTWNGPGWIPGKSTLLQVLVSIQSLIFVQNPYYNEPGFEAKKSPAAEKENMRHREHTLSFAVLAPLRKPDVMFADVISQHFQQKREEVEQQCHQWWAKASDANTKDRMANLMKAIKSQLQILCS
jgi:baculoviral IAP repeat-containing protein 6